MDLSGAFRPRLTEDQARRWQQMVGEITGQFILGLYTEEFERRFAALVGKQFAVAVGSGSAALEIAFRYFRNYSGLAHTKVLLPTNAFPSIAWAAQRAGFDLVCGPLDPGTYGLDLSRDVSMETGLHGEPGVVVVVPIAGIVDPRQASFVSRVHDCGHVVVVDASHAHGVVEAAQGDAVCYSLYATKILTTGVGGILATDDEALAVYARTLRHHGADPATGHTGRPVRAGWDWLMSEAQAALGLAQLPDLSATLYRRTAVALRYEDNLMSRSYGRLCPGPYKTLLTCQTIRQRDRVQGALAQRGVAVDGLYPVPVYVQPGVILVEDPTCATTERDVSILARTLALPVAPLTSLSPVDEICHLILPELSYE